VEIKEIGKGPRYIYVLIREDPNGQQWRGTFVYGDPKALERHHMWTTLRKIKPFSSDPWLMLGDFNKTMWQNEHFSETKRSERRMEAFRSTLAFCNLFDLGFLGPAWTIDNRKKGCKNVKSRLDRAVASDCWSSKFPNSKVTHLCSTRSDHLPILIEYDEPSNSREPMEFKYESMWDRDPGLALKGRTSLGGLPSL
jgi:hypothetical protein